MGIIYSSALELSCFAEVPGFYCSQEKKNQKKQQQQKKETHPKDAVFFVSIEILWLFQAADWVALITPCAGSCQVFSKCHSWLQELQGAAKSCTWFSVIWPSSEFLEDNKGLWESLLRVTDYIWCCTRGVWYLGMWGICLTQTATRVAIIKNLQCGSAACSSLSPLANTGRLLCLQTIIFSSGHSQTWAERAIKLCLGVHKAGKDKISQVLGLMLWNKSVVLELQFFY